MQIPLIQKTGSGFSTAANAQRSVNCFPVVSDSGKSNITLRMSPGLRKTATVGSGPIRALHIFGGYTYVLSGTQFYRKFGNELTLLGAVNTASGVAKILNNGIQLAIVAAGKVYVHTIGTTGFGEVTDPDFLGAVSSTYADGYGIYTDGKVFYISGLYDFTVYDGLDFASAESSPDPITAVIQDHSELYVFGLNSCEVFQNTGNASFPFERLGNGKIERGTAAPKSVVKEDNSVFFLGDDVVIYRLNGFQPQRVSTEQVEVSMSKMSTVTDCYAFSYTQESHKFVVFSFPSAGITWVYDIASDFWHERSSFGVGSWRVSCVEMADTKVYAGDSVNGNIYEIDTDYFTEDGELIRWSHVLPVVGETGKKLFHNRLEIDIDAGQGTESGYGSDPMISLDFSDDGGRSWTNKLHRSMGKIGEYLRRAIWDKLGAAYWRNYRISGSYPIKTVVIRADLQASKGVH